MLSAISDLFFLKFYLANALASETAETTAQNKYKNLHVLLCSSVLVPDL